jgi:Rrf2 family protein
MRISAKGEYAIRALLDLAVHHGEGLVPIQEVARRQNIPQRYLEQVLLLLKRAGILESKRGSAGGYQLVRPPSGISVGDVLRAVEGRVTALDVAGRHPSKTSDGAASDLAPLWREMAAAVGEVIDRTTFGDLAEQAKARRSPERSIYHI